MKKHASDSSAAIAGAAQLQSTTEQQATCCNFCDLLWAVGGL
jgi:hypothetical protein